MVKQPLFKQGFTKKYITNTADFRFYRNILWTGYVNRFFFFFCRTVPAICSYHNHFKNCNKTGHLYKSCSNKKSNQNTVLYTILATELCKLSGVILKWVKWPFWLTFPTKPPFLHSIVVKVYSVALSQFYFS